MVEPLMQEVCATVAQTRSPNMASDRVSCDRYRVVVFGRPRGPWRKTKEHAVQDAIDMGLAAYDRSRREHFIAVPTDIEWRSFNQPG